MFNKYSKINNGGNIINNSFIINSFGFIEPKSLKIKILNIPLKNPTN